MVLPTRVAAVASAAVLGVTVATAVTGGRPFTRWLVVAGVVAVTTLLVFGLAALLGHRKRHRD